MIFFVAACGGGEEEADNAAPPRQMTMEERMAQQVYAQLQQSTAELPAFKQVVNSESDRDELLVLERRIVLLDEPTRENIRALLDHHYQQLAAIPDPEDEKPVELVVLVYETEAAVRSNVAWIGSSIKSADEEEPTVEILVE